MTDIICLPEGPIEPGSDRRATIRLQPGGSGANQASWLAACGLAVRFAARVGAADVARLTADFGASGVDARLAADTERPSGTLVTLVAPDGERSFLTDRGANAHLSGGDLPELLLDDCAVLVISGYALFEPGPRTAVGTLMARARDRHIPVAVDPASVGFLRELGVGTFLAATRGATTLFANEAEALVLAGTPSLAGALPTLNAAYGRVVVKRGAAGALIATRGGIEIERPAPAVTAIDTTGAGDAFAAAFIAAELSGMDEAAALERAVLAGAEAVTWIGGRPPHHQDG
jgi:sugar/nucleoside kinase (ribokinase family)